MILKFSHCSFRIHSFVEAERPFCFVSAHLLQEFGWIALPVWLTVHLDLCFALLNLDYWFQARWSFDLFAWFWFRVAHYSLFKHKTYSVNYILMIKFFYIPLILKTARTMGEIARNKSVPNNIIEGRQLNVMYWIQDILLISQVWCKAADDSLWNMNYFQL